MLYQKECTMVYKCICGCVYYPDSTGEGPCHEKCQTKDCDNLIEDGEFCEDCEELIEALREEENACEDSDDT